MPYRFLLLPALLLFCLTTGAIAAEPQNLADVRGRLQQDFPRLRAGSIAPTPIEGMYAVSVDLNLIYYFPASGHLINGALYDKSGTNLTEKAQNEQLTTIIAGLPLDKAVKIGHGPIPVIEVTDPDCPYCRKASDFFNDKDALVTRYVFFFPLRDMHPNAAAKASWILAAKDGAAAYHEIMAGKYDKTPLPAFTDSGRLAEHQAIAQKLGVRGTPQFFLKGEHIGGADIPALAKLIGVAVPAPAGAAKTAPPRPTPAKAK